MHPIWSGGLTGPRAPWQVITAAVAGETLTLTLTRGR